MSVMIPGVVNSPVFNPPPVLMWSAKSVPNGNDGTREGVCWSPELDLFVMCVGSPNTYDILYSTDGDSWTGVTLSPSPTLRGVCWSSELNLFVAVGSGSPRCATSPDGINWTTRTIAQGWWRAVCWSPELELFVAVGDANPSTVGIIATSPDGINWIVRSHPTDAIYEAVCWSPSLSLFVAVGDTATLGSIAISPDGINWTPDSSVASSLHGVCWSPELGLLCAISDTVCATSPDGINWVVRSESFGINRCDVCWSSELELFVAVDYSGAGKYSKNAIDWSVGIFESRPTNFRFNKICWSPGLGVFAASGTASSTSSCAIGVYE